MDPDLEKNSASNTPGAWREIPKSNPNEQKREETSGEPRTWRQIPRSNPVDAEQEKQSNTSGAPRTWKQIPKSNPDDFKHIRVPIIRSPKMNQDGAEQRQRAGRVLESAGRVLTKTKVGAEVGVPLQVAGTILRNRSKKQERKLAQTKSSETISQNFAPGAAELSKDVQAVNESQKRFQKRNRVSKVDTILMVSVALIFDLCQIGLEAIGIGWLFNWIISIFAWCTFYVWTSIKGWGWSDTMKKVAINWGIPLMEIFPFLNDIPAWTLRVMFQIAIVKAEDAVYNLSQGKADIENIKKFGIKYGSVLKKAA